MRKLLRTTATVASALSIAGGGIAGIAGASSMSNTGYNSDNKIENHNSKHVDVDNDTDVHASSFNGQYAHSGFAGSFKNTRGGDSRSGNASNGNTGNTTVRATSSSSAAVAGMSTPATSSDDTIRNTGADSDNKIENNNYTRVDVDNDTDVCVSNISLQGASSGSAVSAKNTRGGNATSGNATNNNNQTTEIVVSSN